jgi:hypothetical protein
MFRSIVITALFTISTYLPIIANGEQPIVGTLPATVPPAVDIAFVGNSLTAAGPIYSWAGQWGMAASQPDKDYVHRVQLRLAAYTGVIPEIAVYSADLHKPENIVQAAQKVATARPRILVVQMGDNADPNSDYQSFRDAYTLLRNAAPAAKLIYVGVWQYDDVRNQHIRRIAQEDNATYVHINDLYLDPSNQATAQGCTDTHGVCWHPSDAGMALIAGRVYSAILGPVRNDYGQ